METENVIYVKIYYLYVSYYTVRKFTIYSEVQRKTDCVHQTSTYYYITNCIEILHYNILFYKFENKSCNVFFCYNSHIQMPHFMDGTTLT